MDPDTTLQDIRYLAQEWKNGYESGHVVDELVEKFTALDEWLSKGGFVPTAWNATYYRPSLKEKR